MLKQVIILFIIFITICSCAYRKPKTALFISQTFIGHINPLVFQAIELHYLHGIDYYIYIIGCSNMKTHVETKCLNTTIQFLDVGQCYNETEVASNGERIATKTSRYVHNDFDE